MFIFIKKIGICIASPLLCCCYEQDTPPEENYENTLEETLLFKTTDNIISTRKRLKKSNAKIVSNTAEVVGFDDLSLNPSTEKHQVCQIINNVDNLKEFLVGINRRSLDSLQVKKTNLGKRYHQDLINTQKRYIKLYLTSWDDHIDVLDNIVNIIRRYLQYYTLEDCTLCHNLPKGRSVLIQNGLFKHFKDISKTNRKLFKHPGILENMSICHPSAFLLAIERDYHLYHFFKKGDNNTHMIHTGTKHLIYHTKKRKIYHSNKEAMPFYEEAFYIGEPRWFKSNSCNTKYLVFFRTNGEPIGLYEKKADVYIVVFDQPEKN